jgi:hypothetical protein
MADNLMFRQKSSYKDLQYKKKKRTSENEPSRNDVAIATANYILNGGKIKALDYLGDTPDPINETETENDKIEKQIGEVL